MGVMMSCSRPFASIVSSIVSSIVAAVAMLPLASCEFQSDHSNTRYRCEQSQSCPNGFQCVQGFCESEERAEDVAGRCGTPTMLSDDFSTASPDLELWEITQADSLTVEHSAGQLVFGFPANIEGNASYRSLQLHGFAEGVAFVEVPALDTSSAIELTFAIESHQGNVASIRHSGESLLFSQTIGGTDGTKATVTYSPDEHRYWRLREHDSRVYWETSGNGRSWKIHATDDSTLLSGPALMNISAKSLMPSTEDRTVAVSNINGGVPSQERWCAASALTDDYNDPQKNPSKWLDVGGSDCTVQNNSAGELRIVTPGGLTPECGQASHLPVDLTASTIAVEATVVTGASNSLASRMKLAFANGDEIAFEKNGAVLSGTRDVQGNTDPGFSEAYDETAHRWWRFRGENGILHWETSPDGLSWNTQASHESPAITLDEVTISLLCATLVGSSNSTCHFDNVNLPPL